MMPTPQDTRTALLDAATELFARRGFAASVREITARARANLGAVTYHFGSKQALFETVLTTTQGALAERLKAAADQPGPSLDRIEAMVRAHFAFMSERPHARRLIMHAMLLDRGLPAAVADRIRGIFQTFIGVISEGQSAGQIRAGDPRFLTMSVIAPSIVVNLLRPGLKALGGVDLDHGATRESVVEHITQFIRSGLARPESPEAAT